MAITASPYGAAMGAWMTGSLVFIGASMRCALAGSTYTPNVDADDFFNDVTGECVGQTGYTAGGFTLTNTASSFTAGTNTFAFDADDASWSNSTIQARYAIVYMARSGGSAVSPLVCITDFGQTMSSNNGTFQITWAAGGIISLQAT